MNRAFAMIFLIFILDACIADSLVISGTIFSGNVGQFEQGRAFTAFLIAQENSHVVVLDVTLSDVEGNIASDEPWFIIWEGCTGRERDKRPTPRQCTGTKVTLSGKNDRNWLFVALDGVRLKGNFEFTGWTGPHNGLISCILTSYP